MVKIVGCQKCKKDEAPHVHLESCSQEFAGMAPLCSWIIGYNQWDFIEEIEIWDKGKLEDS